MARPRLPRKSCCRAKCTCLSPEGARREEGVEIKEVIKLFSDERNALKLHDVDGLEQKEAAGKMGVSQPTFARIIKSAHLKTSRAVVEGKKLIID